MKRPRECPGCHKSGIMATKFECRACYERRRRHRLKVTAESDPALYAHLKTRQEYFYIRARERGHYSTVTRRIGTAMKAYRRKDPNSEITPEWMYENIIGKSCFYCGISDTEAKQMTGQFLSVDRKVPKLGYAKSNCIPACKACNTAKLNLWSVEETLELGKLIKAFYARRRAS